MESENLNEREDKLSSATEYARKAKTLIQKRFGEKSPLACVRSYGCKQNSSDGEKIKGLLRLVGYDFTDDAKKADLVIYNTCAVRENAEDRVYGDIGELKHCKEKNPEMIIGLCGCMTQQEHITEKIKKSYPQVDIIFGTQVIDRLPKLLYETLKNHRRIFDLTLDDTALLEDFPTVREENASKADLPIMYGCDNFCSYCVVPYVRGRERSRESKKIIGEFEKLVGGGCKEIMLLGQNVNSYGKGLFEDVNFSALLRRLNAVDGDFQIRFMSSHPKDASFELIDTIAECEKVCKHFHLPIQSGSDRILKLMNRRYGVEDYCRLVDYARSKIPDIAFTSDIIIGFPGETEEDFLQTVELIKRVRYDSIFSFIYSPRVGTKAAGFEDDTPYKTKSERFSRLLKVQKEIGHEKYLSSVGKTYRVLFDGTKEDDDSVIVGRNSGYAIIYVKADKSLIGQFARVKITKSLGWALEGELV